MISTRDFRNGAKIELDGEPYAIVEFQFFKPGKGGAFVKTRIKSLKTGNVLDKNFRSGEKFQEPDILEREAQYLYASWKRLLLHGIPKLTNSFFFLRNRSAMR